MKRFTVLGIAIVALLATVVGTVHAGYSARFLGRCQQCTRGIYAHYQPVECTNGCVEWRWVTQKHNHCRPTYKGDRKNDFFRSHLFNPANKKRNKHEPCGPFAVGHGTGQCNSCK